MNTTADSPCESSNISVNGRVKVSQRAAQNVAALGLAECGGGLRQNFISKLRFAPGIPPRLRLSSAGAKPDLSGRVWPSDKGRLFEPLSPHT